jgi:transposase InsO family protein
MCAFHKAHGATEDDLTAWHWDRDCTLPEARLHFKNDKSQMKVPTPFQTASAMHAMVEEEVDQDSPEVYDEAYYDQVDYAHMAFHIPQNEVDDACFQSRSSAPVSSRNHTVPHVTLITENPTAATSPAVASALPSVTTAPAQSADTRGIILFLLAVIIFLVIPDRLHAAAVSSCVCLVTHFQYVNSSISSVITSIAAYLSSMSPARTYKLSFASLCITLLVCILLVPDAAYGHHEVPVAPEYAMLASIQTHPKKFPSACIKWITFLCDSGASNCICIDRDALGALFGSRTPVLTGDKVITYSHGVGTLKAMVDTDNGPKSVNIDCLYMPTFSTNLLSVTALRNQGCTTVFPPSGTASYIKLPCGSAVTLREENKVHYLDLQPRSASDEQVVNVAMTAHSTMAWHKRLGHLNFAAMKKMAQARMLPGLSAAEFVPSFCHHCPQGKLTVAQFPQQSMSRALVPLGRVCTDISGPHFQSSQRVIYYHVFVDEYSGMRWAYTMENKKASTLLRNFKQFLADVGSPRCFRLDRDAVFTCGDFRSLARDNQIRLEYCQPRRHEQNGLAERTVRSLNSMTRILLISSKLPDHLWPYALQYSVWLQNRLPSRNSLLSNSCTVPLTLYSGIVPNPSWFRVFGAVTYAINDAHHRAKLGPQAVRCRFLGYSTEVGKPSAICLAASGRPFYTRELVVDPEGLSPPPDCAIFDEPPSTWSSTPDSSTPDHQLYTPVLDPGVSRDARTNPVPGRPPRVLDFEPVSLPSVGVTNFPVSPTSVGAPSVEAPSVGAVSDLPVPGPFTPTHSPPPSPAPVRRSTRIAANHPAEHSVISAPANPVQPELPGAVDVTVNISPFANRSSEEPANPLDICVAALRHHESQVEWEKCVERAMVAVFMKPEPKSYKQAMDLPGWAESMQREVSSMYEQEVWEEVRIADLPPNTTVIDSKWVFRNKPGINDAPDTQKSRFVARGDQEDEVEDKFSPVGRMEAIRLMFTLAVIWDMECNVCDVPVAFLNAPIPADKPQVYMHLPLGFKKPGYVVRLKKCIYGLQESPRLWNQMLHTHMLSLGFEQSKVEPCLYVKRKNGKAVVFVLVYVDDLMTVGATEDVADFENKMVERFQVKQHGAITSYCGLEFHRDRCNRTGEITMEKFIDKMLFNFALKDITPTPLPYKVGHEVHAPEPAYDKQHPITEAEKAKMTKVPYRNLVASLLWLSTTVRFDISFVVKRLTQNYNAPKWEHWEAAKTVLAYLKGTSKIGIKVNANSTEQHTVKLETYCDADWAGDRTTRRSTTGTLTLINSTPISWRVCNQKSVATSTMESEYMGLAEATKETLYLRMLLADFDCPQEQASPIWEDNNPAICLSKESRFHSRAKHVDIQYHFTRDTQHQGKTLILQCSTLAMLADILTKYVGREIHQRLYMAAAGYAPIPKPSRAIKASK